MVFLMRRAAEANMRHLSSDTELRTFSVDCFFAAFLSLAMLSELARSRSSM